MICTIHLPISCSTVLYCTSELRALSLSLSLWGLRLRGFVGSRVRMLSGVWTLTKISLPFVTICIEKRRGEERRGEER